MIYIPSRVHPLVGCEKEEGDLLQTATPDKRCSKVPIGSNTGVEAVHLHLLVPDTNTTLLFYVPIIIRYIFFASSL